MTHHTDTNTATNTAGANAAGTNTAGTVSTDRRTSTALAPDATLGPVDAFLAALSRGDGIPAEIYATDATLDATVPNWRLDATGGPAVAAELSRWYWSPTSVHATRRRVLDVADDLADDRAGARTEAVEVELSWSEDGIPHAGHQMHVITVGCEAGCDVIASHTIFCGGRWPAALLADMEAARAR